MLKGIYMIWPLLSLTTTYHPPCYLFVQSQAYHPLCHGPRSPYDSRVTSFSSLFQRYSFREALPDNPTC